MDCVVLPSETARLVYGYLVKEDLNNIALQFLENSPYLTDCCNIVKKGLQFNTKFLSKDLHELLQDYSAIHNLVDKKVGLLPKTSPLYKQIKLHCENLSEVLNQILFWKCNETEHTQAAEVYANKTAKLPENKAKANTTTASHEINSNSSQNFRCGNYINIDNIENSNINGVNDDELGRNSNTNGLGSMDCDKNCTIANADNDRNRTMCVSSKTTTEVHNTSVSELSKDSVDKVSIPIENNLTDKTNVMNSLITNDYNVGVDEQIKLFRGPGESEVNMEKTQLTNSGQLQNSYIPTNDIQNVTEIQNSFPQNVDGMDMDNNSVLYVAPDVGNLLNQDRNQFIVIPLDYCKMQNQMGNAQNQALMGGNMGSTLSTNNEQFFEDMQVAQNLMPNTTVTNTPQCSMMEKRSYIDDNIITEDTFLKHNDLIYELESKIKPQIFPHGLVGKNAEPTIAITTASTTVPVSTAAVSSKQTGKKNQNRQRRILPKSDYSQTNPVVVLQPLIEKHIITTANSDLSIAPTKTVQSVRNIIMTDNVGVASTSASTLAQAPPPAKTDNAEVAVVNNENGVKAAESRIAEIFDMPSIITPTHDRVPTLHDGEKTTEKEQDKKLNEEKENLDTEDKALETPLSIKIRISKLSLSTPRRKNHIRALEFETPPKSGHGKKSNTSPKSKADDTKTNNKSVRNTLFKSPDADLSVKIPSSSQIENAPHDATADTPIPKSNTVTPDESLNESSGGALKVQNKENKPLQSWDSDLRKFIRTELNSCENKEKDKRPRKSRRKEKESKPKKHTKKDKSDKAPSSSISFTAKRHTYSISGNETSPVHSLLDDLDLVTPHKDVTDAIRSAEETPLTKFIRETGNGLDLDLNMIKTPLFPPTPNIGPLHEGDESLSGMGAFYYTPMKDNSSKEKAAVTCEKPKRASGESVQCEKDEIERKKGAKEAHEKVIGEIVSKAKEIVGLKNDPGSKRPLSGKVLSMVKIQMISQCDKKLYENIPIHDNPVRDATTKNNDETLTDNSKYNLEYDNKDAGALGKIKIVRKSPSSYGNRVTKKSGPKRRKSAESEKPSKKRKRNSQSDSFASDKLNESSDGMVKEVRICQSTPIRGKSDLDGGILDEIRKEFPEFVDTGEFPDLPLKTRKKIHYIRHFLKFDYIVACLVNVRGGRMLPLQLKRSHRRFFDVFYKWLRHPHSREVNTNERVKGLFKEFRTAFDQLKSATLSKLPVVDLSSDNNFVQTDGDKCVGGGKDDAKALGRIEDTEDGPVTVLPLKKRKSTVLPIETPTSEGCPSERAETPANASQAQTFLQHIDVDSFLSQIHGQEKLSGKEVRTRVNSLVNIQYDPNQSGVS